MSQVIGLLLAVGLWGWIVFREWWLASRQWAERQSAEERRRFLQRLDHELKNPLTAIQAGLSNLTVEPLEDHMAEEVSAVKTQVHRISRLVADLRKLAALEVTSLELSFENNVSII